MRLPRHFVPRSDKKGVRFEMTVKVYCKNTLGIWVYMNKIAFTAVTTIFTYFISGNKCIKYLVSLE
jgi:hypothetical protein